MRISTVINQKGGVGKTTTAHSLIAGLHARGFKVLAVDCDAQGNLSYGMRANTDGPGLFEALSKKNATGLIQKTNYGGIIPASTRLTGADKVFTGFGMEFLLKNALDPLSADYDYIIIDSPPQLGLLTINALVASTDVIIPITTDIFAIQGLTRLLETLERVRAGPNPQASIDGLLLTRYSGRTVLSRDLREALQARAEHVGSRLYNSTIREGVALRESQARRMSVFEYAPKSKTALDYEGFIGEYLG